MSRSSIFYFQLFFLRQFFMKISGFEWIIKTVSRTDSRDASNVPTCVYICDDDGRNSKEKNRSFILDESLNQNMARIMELKVSSAKRCKINESK